MVFSTLILTSCVYISQYLTLIMFQKLANFEKKISQRIATRKARKQALRKAKEDFKNLKKEIKESSNPAKFLGKSATVKKSTKKNKLTKKATTKKVAKKTARMSKAKVSKKYGKKIVFKKNQKNAYSHADKGDIDGKFTAFAELSEWLVVSPNPQNTRENRIFFNFVEQELKEDFIKVAKREGFEVSFK